MLELFRAEGALGVETVGRHGARILAIRMKLAATNERFNRRSSSMFRVLAGGCCCSGDRAGEESPGLVVLKNNRLYVLSLKSPGSGQGPATTECDLHILDPKQSTVICQTKYIGE
jgi:hypothetical protein